MVVPKWTTVQSALDLVSFQNDGTGADENTNAPSMASTAAPTKTAAWVGEKLIHGLA